MQWQKPEPWRRLVGFGNMPTDDAGGSSRMSNLNGDGAVSTERPSVFIELMLNMFVLTINDLID